MQVGNEAGLVAYDPNYARYSQARYNFQNMMGAMGRQAQAVQRSIVNNPGTYGLLGGMVPGVTTAISELQEDRPVGAAGAVVGGAGGAGIGAGIARMIPGVPGKVAQFALPLVGGLVGAPSGAQAAEYAKRKITNEPTRGKEGELGSVLAAREKIGQQDLSMLDRTLGITTSKQMDLMQFYMDAEREQLQKMNPLIQKMRNAELVRNQAMANTMASNYAMLGTVATAGKLATGAQEQAGANLRTALTSNPYAGSVMQAPNISFG
jgi:hypothetical protein